MRARVNALLANAALACVAAAVGPALLPEASAQGRESPEDHFARVGENRWVPSLAVRSGVWLQSQHGDIDSCLFQNPADATGACPGPPVSMPLRPPSSDDDLAIASFVGANLELMSPALPIPTRPRLFASGEILPTFSADRDLAGEGDPSCIKGPLLTDVDCVDPTVPRTSSFSEADINGEGSKVTTNYDTLWFGASFGVAFPLQVGERWLRIKPSVGWISYKAELEGRLVDGECEPPTSCTAVIGGVGSGTLREVNLTGSDSRRFHAIGPGLDVEMDTGRFGPLGTSIFLGGRAYRTFGNRRLEAETTTIFPNDGLPLEGEAASARWEAELKPWIYQAGVGLRVQWLGWRK